MARTITKEYYEVIGGQGYGTWGLSDKFPSLEDAIKGATELNEREAKKGYTPSDWIITRTCWARQIEDDGTLIFEDTHTSRVLKKGDEK